VNTQQLAGWLAASRRNPPQVGFSVSFDDAKAAGSSALDRGLSAAKSEASDFADRKIQEGKEATASAVRSTAGDAAGNIADAALGVNQNIMFTPAMINATSSMLNKGMLTPSQRTAFLDANKARNIASQFSNLRSRGFDLSKISPTTVLPSGGGSASGGSQSSPFELDAGPAPAPDASDTSAAEGGKPAEAAEGLSTGAKVGIGLGVAAVIGGAAWFILKSRA
jgi:hypothetical protein